MTSLLRDPDPKFKQKQRAFYIISSLIIVLAIAMLYFTWSYLTPTSADSANFFRSEQARSEESTESLATYNDPAGRFSFQYDPANTDLQPASIIREVDLESVSEEITSPDSFTKSFLEQERTVLQNNDQAGLQSLYGLGQNPDQEQVFLEIQEHTDGSGIFFRRYIGEDPGYLFSYIFYSGNDRIEIFKQISLLDMTYIADSFLDVYRIGPQAERLDQWHALINSGDGATESLLDLQRSFGAIINTLQQS
ncbi:hypothetical protein ACFL1U_00280 [Patescibacteria group bacterium]